VKRQKKKIKEIQIKMKKIKLSLFAAIKILYTKDTKNTLPKKKNLDLIKNQNQYTKISCLSINQK
jgi:RNase P subunit RPR2